MADNPYTDPPQLAPLPPDKEQRLRDSTVIIERTDGGFSPRADGQINAGEGSGVVIANSGGRIVTAEHVVYGNGQDDDNHDLPDYKDPITKEVKQPEIKIYTADHELIGTARIITRGHARENDPARKTENDQAVLEMTDFATPEMKEKYKTLGMPLAKDQSAGFLAFRLPDRTTLKPGNSGGPAVNMDGDLIGLNAGISLGTSRITPMSNRGTLAAMGEAGRNIRVHSANGKPMRAEIYGYRGGSSYRFGAELYQSSNDYDISPIVPSLTQSFVAAADEVGLRKNAEQEALPSFIKSKYGHEAMYDEKGTSFFRVGHTDEGQSYVNYSHIIDGKARQVILYFNDKNDKIVPWMQQQYQKDQEGLFKTLLGDNKTDLAQLYKTLNDVAQDKPGPAVVAQASPPPAPQRSPAPEQPKTPAAPPASAATSSSAPAAKPPVPAKPHAAQHHARRYKAPAVPATERHDASTDFLNDIEYNLHHPEKTVENKDAAYLAAEKTLMARHEEIDPDLIAARQKQAEPHSSNLNALKSSDPKQAKTQTAAASRRNPGHTV